MFLRSLVIEGVRSIEYLKLDFTTEDLKTRKWTIVLGENGTGKSTALRAAALVLGGSDLLPVLVPDAAVWVRNAGKVLRIKAEISTARNELREISLEINRGDTPSEIVKRNHKNLKLLDAALGHSQRNYFVAGYGASRRLPGPKSATFESRDSFSHPRAQAVATLFSGDATLRALDAWAMDLDYRLAQTGMEMIKNALGELLPGVTFSRIDRSKRQLLFQTPDGVVPLQQLSDGYQNIASWIGDLLFRITETFKNYRRPLEARGILLLDEIDLHLHPIWQRQLLLFLDRKLPNFQILATTHSPFTAQQAAPGSLHVLERAPASKGKPGLITARQYGGDPKLLRVDQLLEPLLGLGTTESVAAEELRERQKALRKKTKRTSAEERDFQQLTTAVRDLPEVQRLEEPEKKRFDLLRRIEKHLDKPNGSGGSVKARARSKGAAVSSAPPVEAIESAFAKLAVKPSVALPGGAKTASKSRRRARARRR